MKKTVTLTKSATTFMVPAKDILALWNGVSKEHTRYYLNGVYIECDPYAGSSGDGVNLVATDGHVLLKKLAPARAFVGNEVTTQETGDAKGFILKLDVAEKAFKAKPVGDLWLHGDIETGIIQFLDVSDPEGPEEGENFERLGVCEFTRIDGTFPDWRRVLPREGAEGADFLSFNPELLTRFQKAAKVFMKTACLKLSSATPGDPMRVEFKGIPALVGVLMPMRFT